MRSGSPIGSRLLAAAFAVVCLARPATAQVLQDFGWATTRTHDSLAIGPRPLLTILVDFHDQKFAPDQDGAFYESLLFGTELGEEHGSVAGRGGFFDENSAGLFWFTNAGSLGPFPAIDNPDTLLLEDWAPCGAWDYVDRNGVVLCGGRNWTMQTALRQAADAGFDFWAYDTNGDNLVTPDELMVLFVFASQNGEWGTFRGTWPEAMVPVATRNGVTLRVWGGWPAFHADVDVATVAHELTHALGVAWEGYGHSHNENTTYSTMGATITGVFRERSIYHLDPFVKMKLGWLFPTIVPVSANTNLCLKLEDIESARAGTTQNAAAILYDPTRGTNEFLMLEYRRSLEFNYDGDPWRTGKFGMGSDRGLAAWAVQIDANKEPLAVPSFDQARNCGADTRQRCQDSAVHIYPPSGRAGVPSPGEGLWTPADGVSGIYWLSDSALMPVTLHVAGSYFDGASIGVEVGRGSCPTVDVGKSFWDVPPGLENYERDRLTAEPPNVPLVVDRWTHPKFVIERMAHQWVRPGVPEQVTWSVSPREALASPVQLRILETVSSAAFDGHLPETSLLVSAGDTTGHSASYQFSPDSGSSGSFPVAASVYFESPADGSTVDPAVGLESVLRLVDPALPPVASVPVVTDFASFHGRVEVCGSRVEAKAVFTLGTGSDGVDPAAEEVFVTVGSHGVVVPARSFRRRKPGIYTFEGTLDGEYHELRLARTASSTYELRVATRLEATPSSLGNMTLRVGNDGGGTSTARVDDRR